MSQPTGTYAMQLTPPGRSAVAVVLVAGSDATAMVNAEFESASGKSLTEQPLDRICFGIWSSDGEELIVVRRAENQVEVHCHGGQAAVRCVIQSLVKRNAIELSWTDWIQQNASSRIESEAALALAKARTLKTAAILVHQQQGALQRGLTQLHQLLADGDQLQATVLATELLQRSHIGLHLTTPWRVTLCGKPNVGKSSLLNLLVGYDRAIVFNQPGTTRDIVTAWTALDGWPVELSDSAGLRTGEDMLEVAGVELAMRNIKAVDLRVLVLDASESNRAEDQRLWEEIQPEIVCSNKSDLAVCRNTLGDGPATVVSTSALTGEGLDELIGAIVAKLIPDPPRVGDAVPFSLAQQAMLSEVVERLATTSGGVAELLAPYLC